MSLNVGELNAILRLNDQQFRAGLASSGQAMAQTAQTATRTGASVSQGLAQGTAGTATLNRGLSASQASLTGLSGSARTAGVQVSSGLAAGARGAATLDLSTSHAGASLSGLTGTARAAGAAVSTGLQSGTTGAHGLGRSVSETTTQVTRLGSASTETGNRVSVGMRTAATSTATVGTSARASASEMSGLQVAVAGVTKIAGALGIAVGVSKVVDFFKDTIGASRTLGAQTNQLTVLFGKQKAEMMAWGKGAVDTLRMSQREAQGAAIQFAAFGKAADLTGPALAKFSKDMTKLAAETASFYGVPADTVIADMGSAMQGQSDPMRKYGVLLNAAELQTIAMKNGIISTTKEALTPQQTVLVTQIALHEKLSAVNGDLERSTGKYGANLKELKAKFEDVSAEIGNKLIPYANSLAGFLAGPGIAALHGFGVGLETVIKTIGQVAQFFQALPGPVKAALGAVVLFKVASMALGGPLSSAASAIRGIGSATTAMVQTSTMGAVQMGRFGSSVAQLGQHAPVVARMQGAFVNAAAGASTFARTQGAVAAASVGAKAGVSGLVGALGGPFGIAITAAIAGLMIWSSKSREAKAQQEAAKAATMEWTQAFKESHGAITQAIRDKVALEAQEKGLITAGKSYGISAKETVDALLMQGDGADKFRAKLQAVIDTNKNGFTSGSPITRFLVDIGAQSKAEATLNGTGQAAQDLLTKFNGLTDAQRSGAEGAKLLEEANAGVAGATEDVAGSTSKATGKSLQLNDALKTLGDTGASSSDKVTALGTALDLLSGGAYSAEDAEAKLAGTLDTLKESFNAGNVAAEAAADKQKSAADAARSAQDTVASSLKSQQQAMHGVVSAEKGYQDAQKASRDATLALTDARKSAAEQLDDLAQSVDNGVLSQRSADLGLIKAKQTLDEKLRDPKATKLDRDEAQLGYDQAKQQIHDLGVQQDRLRAKKAEADRAGIDGSQAVVSAQSAVSKANEGVLTAQDAIVSAKDAVADAGKGLAKAQQDARDATRELQKATQSVQELSLTVDGYVSKSTAAGRNLLSSINDTRDGMYEATQRAYAYAVAHGDLAGAEDAARKAAQGVRDSFITSAKQMGLSQTAAEQLADKYGLIPDKAVTAVSQPGIVEAQMAADVLRDKVNQIKDKKTIVTDALTPDAIAKLEMLGFKTEHLPEGKVKVTANTDSAQASLDVFVQNAQREVQLQITLAQVRANLNLDGTRQEGSGTRLFGNGYGAGFANGGIAEYYASGGVRSENHVAQIAPAGANRHWAEPETGGEGYVPLAPAKRARSLQVMDEIASRFGKQLVPAGQRQGTGGTVNMHNEFHAQQDPRIVSDWIASRIA